MPNGQSGFRDNKCYGIHGQTGANANRATLFCLDLATVGKLGKSGFGVGTVILINNTLVVLSDRGEIAFIKATADHFYENGPFSSIGRQE